MYSNYEIKTPSGEITSSLSFDGIAFAIRVIFESDEK